MPPVDLQWLDLADFRPGIKNETRGHTFASSREALPAVSATDNTYGCIALATGSLVPLPAKTSSYNPAPPGSSGDGVHRINGFHVTGPVTGGTPSGNQSELHIGWEWFSQAARREYRWERHRLFDVGNPIDTVKSHTSTGAPGFGSFRATFFADVRMHPTTATDPGHPLVAGAWYDLDDPAYKFVSTFPNPSTPTSNAPRDISTALDADIIMSHQGRLVIFQQRGWAHGSPGQWISNEQVWYTNPNLPTIQNSTADTFSSDRMTGIGVAKQVSANEMLIVKFQEGGFTLSGDISNPTVIRLPGVMPTYGATTRPVYSKVGLVYGVLGGGVHAWAGGDASQNLSQNLDPRFWHHSLASSYINYDGDFSMWRDWLVVPNGWLFDTDNSGWWRLGDKITQQYMFSGVDYAGTLYVARPQRLLGNPTPSVDVFSYNAPGGFYYWESNFINPAVPGRQVEVRELVLEAQGTGTVTVELAGETVVPGVPVVFTVNSGVAQIKRAAYAWRGTGAIQVRITSTGTVAPMVHSVKVGYQPAKVHVNAA